MQISPYTVAVDRLRLGASYGNPAIFARTDARSNLLGLWCADDDQIYCGRLAVRLLAQGRPMDARSTTFHPAFQATTFDGEGLELEKTFFVPYGTEELRCSYTVLRARSTAGHPCTLIVELEARYPLFVAGEYGKLPEFAQQEKRVTAEFHEELVVARTVGQEHEVRVLGCSAALKESRLDPRCASLRYELSVEPGATVEVAVVLLLSSAGVADALERFARARDHRAAFEQTQRAYSLLLGICDVITPDPLINRALKWAKANILRVQHRFPIGPSFTNDPPQDILVVRDVAWFTMGCDYFTPAFSREALELVRDHGVEPGGGITEFLLACERPVVKYNYGLNINDDTPLFIISVHHHYCLSRDLVFLGAMYGAVRAAADWILAQKRDGLIWCTSEESNLWGICSWRNVIPGYALSGAVTEINAECCLALRLTAACAELLGQAADAERFLAEAEALQAAINNQLVSEQTGLYLLHIDNEGRRHHDLTGDMIFPLLCGLADEDRARRVLDILTGPGFRTEYGLRTVAPDQPNYDPEYGLNLLGGVWPNLTAWTAYADRLHQPERLVEGMRSVFRITESPNPSAFGSVVPGQFPERLHGETFQSRGMAMSPWMPPTYLWLAMEGLLGCVPGTEGITVQPHLPASWSWAAARNVPFAGDLLTFFLCQGTLFASRPVHSTYPVELFEQDVTGQLEADAPVIALRRGPELAIFISAAEPRRVALRLAPPLAGDERTIEVLMEPGTAQVILLRV